jgi:hypothetical protein
MPYMIAIYGFCAVVGGALTLVMLLGADADADVSADLDFDDGSVDGVDGAGSILSSILSFRTIVFALAFFGVTGLLLPLVGAGAGVTLAAAVGMGVFAGVINDRILRYVRRTSGGSGVTDLKLAGSPATVTLPVARGRRGRVSIEVGDRMVSLVAEPFKDGTDTFASGSTVVVVEVREGIARIAHLNLTDGM